MVYDVEVEDSALAEANAELEALVDRLPRSETMNELALLDEGFSNSVVIEYEVVSAGGARHFVAHLKPGRLYLDVLATLRARDRDRKIIEAGDA